MTADFHELLTSRARRAGVTIAPDLASRLEQYFRLLNTWNARMNLTSLSTSPPSVEAVDRLLIEPLAAATWVAPGTGTMLDVGSGSGSPAVPMALAFTPARCIMVESKSRKSVFLRETVRALGLPGEVIATRVEDVCTARPELRGSIDLVTIRAVRIEPRLARVVEWLLSDSGQLFVFGTEFPQDFKWMHLCHLRSTALVEGTNGHLHVYERCST